MAHVAVVTDSTAALPMSAIEKYDVHVVPLQVVTSGRVGAEGRDVTSQDVAAALAARTPVSTSRPTPQAFATAYAAAAAAGADAVVSVHLSAGLSGTVDAARLAAGSAPLHVHVVDSRSTAMGLGFAVLAAAESAAGGADVQTVARAASDTAARTHAFFYVDSLDALRRGGRIGQAAALVGSALMVKPLLYVVDGRIAVLEKIRTASKAIARLEDVAALDAGAGAVDVAVHHLAAPDRAESLAARLPGRMPGLATVYVSEVGAAVGAHVGLGLLGIVIHHR